MHQQYNQRIILAQSWHFRYNKTEEFRLPRRIIYLKNKMSRVLLAVWHQYKIKLVPALALLDMHSVWLSLFPLLYTLKLN